MKEKWDEKLSKFTITEPFKECQSLEDVVDKCFNLNGNFVNQNTDSNLHFLVKKHCKADEIYLVLTALINDNKIKFEEKFLTVKKISNGIMGVVDGQLSFQFEKTLCIGFQKIGNVYEEKIEMMNDGLNNSNKIVSMNFINLN